MVDTPQSNPEKPTIHVVDDDRTFLNSMGRMLGASGYQTALYHSGDEFLANPPTSEEGCLLLDLQMAGTSGFELQDRLTNAGSLLPIIFLTGRGDIGSGVHAIKAGADDFLPKPVSGEVLLRSVEHALARNAEERKRKVSLKGMRDLVASLTPREAQVFSLVVRGKPNKQIAHELGTAVRTVKAHRQSIMAKLEVRSLAEAVSIAERLGILTA